jgi:predicted phosphoribosyltransferase
MAINKETAQKLADKFNINLDVIPIKDFLFGLNAELEHHNITHGSHTITAKIVIAHLNEDPMYYHYLRKLEERRDRYWKTHKKPSIFK